MDRRKLIAWIDRDLQSTSPGGFAAGLVLLPGFASIVAFGFHPLPLTLSIAWGIGWLALLAWRIVALCRRDDEIYDRRTKFMLSREYRTSESASAAAKRRKRRRAKGKTG